jgi:hypothetical protein
MIRTWSDVLALLPAWYPHAALPCHDQESPLFPHFNLHHIDVHIQDAFLSDEALLVILALTFCALAYYLLNCLSTATNAESAAASPLLSSVVSKVWEAAGAVSEAFKGWILAQDAVSSLLIATGDSITYHKFCPRHSK